MKQILQFFRSAVPSKRPTISQLDLGELSMNTYDGKLFMKKSGSAGESVVSFVSWEDISGSISSGSAAINGDTFGFIPVVSISGSLVNSLFFQSGSSISLSGSITVSQDVTANNFFGTASYATTASYYNTKINNIIDVGLTGSNVLFNSIKAAVDSITDASANNTYTVVVYPGIYIEDTITMKSWVTVKGDSSTSTIVSGSNPSASVFIGADQSMIIDMQIQGATAPSASAVVYSSPTTPQTNAIFYVENVRFGTNYTHAKVVGTSGGNCIMQCSNVKYGGYPFTLGFHVTNDGSGIGRMQLRNVTSTNGGVTTTSGLIFAKADQPGCTFIVNGALLTKAVGAAAGTGFWVENGGSLRLTAVNFQRWATAIYAPNTGSSPSVYGTALNFENNTKDVDILHTSATGKIEGTDNFLKVNLNASIPLYEVGKDPRTITVAKKGGDFTSISSAVSWISDSSEINRYVVKVGPGEFIEPPIDLRNKPYVSIVGSDIQSTHVMTSGSHDLFLLGSTSEVSFLTAMGMNDAGYAAFSIEDIDGFALGHKLSIYDFDYGIKVIGSLYPTTFYGEYVDINGSISYGTYVSSSDGVYAGLNMENYYLFPSASATIGNFASGISGSLVINSSVLTGDGTLNSVAIQLEDGADLEANSVDIPGWDIAVYVPNIGVGPDFKMVGTMIHNSATYDFNIQHDQTKGRFQGISNHSKINNTSPNFYWNFLDDEDGENDITRKISVTFEDGTHTDASTLIFKGSGMGLMDGGTLSELTGTTINVGNGYGYVEKTTSPDIVTRLDWSNSQISLPPNTSNYIYLTDAMVLSAATVQPNSTQNIILGRVVTNDTSIEFIEQSPYGAAHTSNSVTKFNRDALASIYVSGSHVTEGSTPFTLDVTAGSYYFSEKNFKPSGTTNANLLQYYAISGGAWSRSYSNVVPNNIYANNSQLVAMSSSYYTKHIVYVVGEGVDERYFLVINDNQYPTLVESETAFLPSPPPYFTDGVAALAAIYVQSGSANITQIQDVRPTIGFKGTGVNASSIHGNLLGLSADDHPQYLRVDGTREMTGSLGLGGNNLYNVTQVSASVVKANTLTGSLQGTASYSTESLTASFASYSPTSSYADSFTVAGTLTAQKLVVQTISSSVEYSSGSNIFGSNLTNTHQFTGSVLVTGSINVNGSITGSLFGTSSASISSSYALSSSYAPSSSYAYFASQATNASTASFVTTAQTASYVLNAINASTASYVTTAQTASFVILAQTASYVQVAQTANTASFATTAQTASYAISASNSISSSYSISSSQAVNALSASYTQNSATASYVVTAQTASYVDTAQTASYVLQAVSSSYATTASFLLGQSATSSYALSASNSISSSYSLSSSQSTNADTASFVTTAQTASYVLNSESSSYSLSSSYALNGGVTSIIAGSNITISPSNGLGSVTINSSGAGGSTFPYTGSAIISGSLEVIGSITGSISTASYANTASYALTASYAINGGGESSISYIALTGSTIFTSGSTGIETSNVSPSNGIFLGKNAGANASSTFTSIFLGFEAGNNASSAFRSIFLGENAGAYANNANYSSFIGSYAGYNATSSYYSNFIGQEAGFEAINARNSNFIGQNAGQAASNASYSNFIGTYTGYNAVSASYSNLFGNYVGFTGNTSNTIGKNNIIIGTGITLPRLYENGINIGGIIFGSGSIFNSGTSAVSGSANGKIGINQPNPQYNFDVSGSGNFTNGLIVSGSLTVTQGITGSLFGSASNANSSSFASLANTASFVTTAQTASYITTAQTASYVLNSVSSSYALSSSQSNNAVTASYVTTAQTASYVLQAVSSSYATTASFATNAQSAQTASYALNSETASYAINASTASFVLNSQTSSYSVTSSYAIDVQNQLSYSAGVISGSGYVLSTGALILPTVKVSIYDNSFFSGSLRIFTVQGGTTGIDFPALTNNDTNYIFIKYNNGSPVYDVSTSEASINNSDVVRYMTAYRANNFVHTLEFGDNGAGLVNKIDNRIVATSRFARESGFALGISGSLGAVTLTEGVAWNGSNRQSLVGVDSFSDVFFKNYHSSSVWTYSTSGDYINNSIYDNGATTSSVDTGKYLVNWYYRGQEINDHIYEVISQGQYDSFASASLSSEPTLPELISSHAFLVGRIIVQSGSVEGSIESAFATVFKSTQIQSHNDLGGIQGGSAGEYYHLNANEFTNLSLKNINNNFTANQTVTGSIIATQGFSGSLEGTSSWSLNSATASYITTAQTASYVLEAVSSSYASLANTASFVVSSSNSLSSSYATTSSYALNGGVTSIIAGTNVNISPSNGLGQVTINATAGAASAFPYTGSAIISGSLEVIGSITGSISTASYATTAETASFVITAQTASFVTTAQTASYVPTAQTASYVLESISSSYASLANTASFITTAQTASYILQAVSASFATLAQTANTASFVNLAQTASFVTTAQTASYIVSASNAVSASYANNSSQSTNSISSSFASLANTASYVTTAQTASYVLQAISSSYASLANTASFVTTAQTANTASYVTTSETASYVITAQTASYILQAVSSSYSSLANTASFVTTAQTASYVLQAVSSSYATTASYVSGALDTNIYNTNGTLTGNRILTGNVKSLDFIGLSGFRSQVISSNDSSSFVLSGSNSNWIVKDGALDSFQQTYIDLNISGNNPNARIFSQFDPTEGPYHYLDVNHSYFKFVGENGAGFLDLRFQSLPTSITSRVLYYDSTTYKVTHGAAATGSVTNVSVTSANGFAGTVATAGTTPAITLSTTVTGLLKGNGTSISAANAGTDYLVSNQTITLSGAVTGSGSTSISTTLSDSVVGISNLSATGTPSSSTYLRGDNTWATVSGGSDYTTTTQTTNYTETATTGKKVILGNTTGGSFTVTLPTAVGNTSEIVVKKIAGTPSLIIDADGSETIDGGLTATLNRVYESITLISDNSNWYII